MLTKAEESSVFARCRRGCLCTRASDVCAGKRSTVTPTIPSVFYAFGQSLYRVLIDTWDWTRMHALVVMHRRTLCENVDSAIIKVPFYTTNIYILCVASMHRIIMYRYIDISIHIDESLHPYMKVKLLFINHRLYRTCMSSPADTKLWGRWGRKVTDEQMLSCFCSVRMTFSSCRSTTLTAPESSAAASRAPLSFTDSQFISSSPTSVSSVTAVFRFLESSTLTVRPWEAYSTQGVDGENAMHVTSSSALRCSLETGDPSWLHRVSSPASAPVATICSDSEEAPAQSTGVAWPPVHKRDILQFTHKQSVGGSALQVIRLHFQVTSKVTGEFYRFWIHSADLRVWR